MPNGCRNLISTFQVTHQYTQAIVYMGHFLKKQRGGCSTPCTSRNINLNRDTLPETNIAPENGWWEDNISFWERLFSGVIPKKVDTSKPTLSSDVGKFLGVKDLHIQLPTNHLADHGTLALRRHCRRTPQKRCLWCWYCRSCQG